MSDDLSWSDLIQEGWDPSLNDFIHLVNCPACGMQWWSAVRHSEMEGEEFIRWREGQRFFNALYEIRPDLAERIRGTLQDPFFAEDLPDSIWAWLILHWVATPKVNPVPRHLATVDDLLEDVLANHPLTGDDRPEGEKE